MQGDRKEPDPQIRFNNLIQDSRGPSPAYVPGGGSPVFSMPQAFTRKAPEPAQVNFIDPLPEMAPAAPNKNTPSFQIRNPAAPAKKKNMGGLSAAREHKVPDFFPGQLDQLKLGPMRVEPMKFMGVSPQINLRSTAFMGFVRNKQAR